MNLRLDLELLLKRHARRVMAILVALVAAGGTGAYLQKPSPIASVTAPAEDGYRLLDERYRAFQLLLIPQQELDATQKAVIDLALGHGLKTGRIDYGTTSHPDGHYRVATLNLPVHGAYKDFRSFVSEMLARYPALAIQEMSVQRATRRGQVDVRLRLAFYATAGEPRP